MRVVGGSASGRRLKSPPSGVRPTSDLVRGAIFDALEAQGADFARVLDLYAGSGALGIEALSRGGGRCDFVERNAANVALIKENLKLTGFDSRGEVHKMEVRRAVDRLAGPYTLVLADPPYEDEEAPADVELVARSHLPARGATLVLEHSRRRAEPDRLGPFALAWRRRYGDTEVSIYRGSEQQGEGVE